MSVALAPDRAIRPPRRAPQAKTCLLVLLAVVSLLAASSCGLTVKGQRVPPHRLGADPRDFVAAGDVAVLHYYGAGGWGIQWRDQYLLLAPYFSNHSVRALLVDEKIPAKLDAVRAGLRNTPVAATTVIVIGHGHVDHVGDVGALFDTGAIPSGRAALVADLSTTNLLAEQSRKGRFSCVAPLNMSDHGVPLSRCVPSAFRITPLHSAHAPHLNALGVDFELFGGRLNQPLGREPERGSDFHIGYPWAFVIDLLDQQNVAVFRIHYMDAAASPPHGLNAGATQAGRDVDVHIGCVPGFNYVTEYPDEVLRWGRVRYVMAAHWEDFFRPIDSPLAPVPVILNDRKLEQFVDKVEFFLGRASRGVAPLPGVGCGTTGCGPRGATWALPVPGETFQFRTGSAAPPR